MRLLRAGVLPAVVAVVVLASGCGPFTGRPQPVEPQQSGYEELETQAALDEPGKMVPRAGAATSPRLAYEMFREAIRSRDFETCWRLLSRDTHDAYERNAADLKMRVLNSPTPPPQDLEILHILGLSRKEADKLTGKTAMIGSFRRAAVRDPEGFELITRTDFDHENLYRDRATVHFTVRDTRQVEQMRLVREGGVWRIEAATPVKTLP